MCHLGLIFEHMVISLDSPLSSIEISSRGTEETIVLTCDSAPPHLQTPQKVSWHHRVSWYNGCLFPVGVPG